MWLVYPPLISDLLVIATSIFLLTKIIQNTRRSAHATPLNGPPRQSLFFGVHRQIMDSEDSSVLYEKWAEEYGTVYRLPSTFGERHVAVCDPKAVAHFFARDTFVYVKSTLIRIGTEDLLGRGLLWAEGEDHRRQRKTLTPAFSNAAIKTLTSVFYDSAHKVKTKWDTALESSSGNGEIIIDVQTWMNRISLDSIGIAGFSHDFGAIDGEEESPIVKVFESFGEEGNNSSMYSSLAMLLTPVLPLLLRIPSKRKDLVKTLRRTMGEIATDLLERTRTVGSGLEKSIIGHLVKSESHENGLRLSQEEILAQMNVLLLAGYETTSISLTWALIELSKHRNVQDRLRKELLTEFSSIDPTWEQMSSGLPYLDAVTNEVLRLHPPLGDTARTATKDEVLPLSQPIITSTGKTVSSLVVSKGTNIIIPMTCIHRSKAFWGPDAAEFNPERWLNQSLDGLRAKDFQGYSHLLTFIDGPRACLGKAFAVAEFKATLSVLLRNYTFELPDGPDTKIGVHESILLRPKVVREEGAKVPLRIRRVE